MTTGEKQREKMLVYPADHTKTIRVFLFRRTWTKCGEDEMWFERLKPALCTENTYLVREGDPVNETLLIIRGHLDSYTTNGGCTSFFNSCRIDLGDFYSEELLTRALGPKRKTKFLSFGVILEP